MYDPERCLLILPLARLFVAAVTVTQDATVSPLRLRVRRNTENGFGPVHPILFVRIYVLYVSPCS